VTEVQVGRRFPEQLWGREDARSLLNEKDYGGMNMTPVTTDVAIPAWAERNP